MGLGGDAERDDNGLPPVDVIVPDDARELDREVVAYHRELRQQRRKDRWRRLARPVRRYGIAPPLIAGAVLIALVSGTLMTVLSPRPTPPAPVGRVAERPTARAGEIGGALPDAYVTIGGKRTHLEDLRPAVIAVVPPNCDCDRAVDELTGQAAELSLKIYLVASRRSGKELNRLAGTAGHGLAIVVEDLHGVLAGTYRLSGLSALLVHTDAVVGSLMTDLQPGMRLQSQLKPLLGPGQGVAAHPA